MVSIISLVGWWCVAFGSPATLLEAVCGHFKHLIRFPPTVLFRTRKYLCTVPLEPVPHAPTRIVSLDSPGFLALFRGAWQRRHAPNYRICPLFRYATPSSLTRRQRLAMMTTYMHGSEILPETLFVCSPASLVSSLWTTCWRAAAVPFAWCVALVALAGGAKVSLSRKGPSRRVELQGLYRANVTNLSTSDASPFNDIRHLLCHLLCQYLAHILPAPLLPQVRSCVCVYLRLSCSSYLRPLHSNTTTLCT
jgi:hypothetical protein